MIEELATKEYVELQIAILIAYLKVVEADG